MKLAQATKNFKAGDIVMRQGDEGNCAYIIETGRVEILIQNSDGDMMNVGTRGEGAIIGEMAIVDAAPRTATVKAIEDCTMLEISRDDFVQRLENADPVIQMISQVILTRYRDTLKRAEILREHKSNPDVEILEKHHSTVANVLESVKIANEFKAALENNQLCLHYQPIINLAKNQIMGFEALMRWEHPEEGFISPGIFIPIIEQSGQIIEASKWATREACAAIGRINKQVKTEKPLYVSVNYSSHDFAQESFVKEILDTVDAASITPSQLKLEITERMLILQPDNAKKTLEACHDAGIGIAIDDFGTGYSSLSYLYYFPIDLLKIDQSFIRAMYREEKSLELVKSIVGLGKNMEMGIIAEGVEAQEEAELLRDIGCDTAQGYHFARPMPEADIIALFNSQKFS